MLHKCIFSREKFIKPKKSYKTLNLPAVPKKKNQIFAKI